MKYLFFDIECADGGKATICSFGYVIADENFKILRREDIVINPQGRFYLTGRAGRPDVHLAYPEATFKRAPAFDKFYNKIKALVENEEYYVVGHSIGDDVTYLNKACARYKLEPFSFEYFDTQRMYRELTEDKKSISLEKALAAFEIDERFRYHQSVEDARATMFLLKALLAKANASFEDYQKGVEMIQTQLVDTLKKIGVETFGERGEEFDPNMHNAVMHTEDDTLGENTVAQVFTKGYKLGNTVIRFAAVQVAN